MKKKALIEDYREVLKFRIKRQVEYIDSLYEELNTASLEQNDYMQERYADSPHYVNDNIIEGVRDWLVLGQEIVNNQDKLDNMKFELRLFEDRFPNKEDC